MTYRNRIARMMWLLAVQSALTASSTFAQATAASSPQQAESQVVSLVSDACPAVRAGEKVSLTWNPNFEHAGMVNGLSGFTLSVARLREDGTEGKFRRKLSGGGKGNPAVSTSQQNGFFHIELVVPADLEQGLYHVVEAEAFPSVYPEYEKQARPQMTYSPASARFCISVMPASKMGRTSIPNP